MKAIVPVAGYGTRLEPHSKKIQKCLLPVAGKTVLEHIIEPLIAYQIDEIVLIIGHLGEQIIEFTKKFPDIMFHYIEQKERLGLGHAVFQGLKDIDEPVLIVLGDAKIEQNYRKFISSEINILGIDEVSNPERFGILDIDGDRIIGFHEKPDNPPSNLAINGTYYFPSQKPLFRSIQFLVDNDIRTKNEYQLTDALQKMLNDGEKFTYQKADAWLDCGVSETLLETNRILLERIGHNTINKNVIIKDSKLINCHISANCIIENSHLNNVIMLEGSQVKNTNISNQIVGFEEIISE